MLPILVMFVPACAGDTRAGEWDASERRRGDTVIVRTERLADAAAVLPLREALRIGLPDGPEEYVFGRVQDVVVSPQGSIFIWDSQLRVLRQYDQRGRFVRQLGRVGAGPGEYGSYNGLEATAHHVLFWDARNARVNVYDTSGTFVTSWPVPRNAGYVEGGLESDTAGRLFVRQPVGDREGFLEVRALDGSVADTLLVPAPEAVRHRLRAANRIGQMRTMLQLPVPYVPESMFAFHPHGYVIVGTGDRYEITLLRSSGPLRIERDVEPTRVDARELAELERILTQRLKEVDPSWTWDGPSIPAHRPFFIGLSAAADGAIWVRRPAAPAVRMSADEIANLSMGAREKPETYDVFGPDGRYRGHVVLPREATLLFVRDEQLWTTLEDTTGIPYVVRFDLGSSRARR